RARIQRLSAPAAITRSSPERHFLDPAPLCDGCPEPSEKYLFVPRRGRHSLSSCPPLHWRTPSERTSPGGTAARPGAGAHRVRRRRRRPRTGRVRADPLADAVRGTVRRLRRRPGRRARRRRRRDARASLGRSVQGRERVRRMHARAGREGSRGRRELAARPAGRTHAEGPHGLHRALGSTQPAQLVTPETAPNPWSSAWPPAVAAAVGHRRRGADGGDPGAGRARREHLGGGTANPPDFCAYMSNILDPWGNAPFTVGTATRPPGAGVNANMLEVSYLRNARMLR